MAPTSPPLFPQLSTYSIVACDSHNGALGVATQSKFLAVGGIVPWAQAGAGAVATQAYGNYTFGPDGLALLAGGLSAQETLARLLSADPEREYRQVGVVDAQGGAATFTGNQCLPWAGGLTGPHFACQGNILVGEETITAMAEAFAGAAGDLAERLTAALAAAQAAGGDRRGQQSAALLVVRAGGGYGGNNDRYVDLRVDDHPAPVQELRRLLALHRLFFQKSAAPDCFAPDEELVRELQELLFGLRYYVGVCHGQLDLATGQALERWAGVENLEERLRDDGLIDPLLLQHLRSQAKG